MASIQTLHTLTPILLLLLLSTTTTTITAQEPNTNLINQPPPVSVPIQPVPVEPVPVQPVPVTTEVDTVPSGTDQQVPLLDTSQPDSQGPVMAGAPILGAANNNNNNGGNQGNQGSSGSSGSGSGGGRGSSGSSVTSGGSNNNNNNGAAAAAVIRPPRSPSPTSLSPRPTSSANPSTSSSSTNNNSSSNSSETSNNKDGDKNRYKNLGIICGSVLGACLIAYFVGMVLIKRHANLVKRWSTVLTASMRSSFINGVSVGDDEHGHEGTVRKSPDLSGESVEVDGDGIRRGRLSDLDPS